MKKSAFKFSSFQEPTLSPFEKLFNIFKELIIHTSGDFDEAIEWLRELDKEYKLTDENYTIDDFVNDLLKKGYIRKEISANGDSIKISSKTERLLRSMYSNTYLETLKKQKKVIIRRNTHLLEVMKI